MKGGCDMLFTLIAFILAIVFFVKWIHTDMKDSKSKRLLLFGFMTFFMFTVYTGIFLTLNSVL